MCGHLDPMVIRCSIHRFFKYKPPNASPKYDQHLDIPNPPKKGRGHAVMLVGSTIRLSPTSARFMAGKSHQSFHGCWHCLLSPHDLPGAPTRIGPVLRKPCVRLEPAWQAWLTPSSETQKMVIHCFSVTYDFVKNGWYRTVIPWFFLFGTWKLTVCYGQSPFLR